MEARVRLAEALPAARSGSARFSLLPALAPSRSIGGRGQFAGRRALPPADNKCCAVWSARWSDSCDGEVCRWVEASPRTGTSRGRAMDPSQGNRLQHRRHQRSLPQHVLCMPGCSRRLRLTCCWMVSTFSFVDSFMPIRHLHIVWKLSTGCARWLACARAYLSRCPRASRDLLPCRMVARPVHGLKTPMPCIQKARALCQSEYAVSLIHQ